VEHIKVLLVDDHEVVRLGLRTLLSNLDYIEIVGEADTGHDAISLVRSTQPDIVLMDIRLPGKNGIETCREVKKQFPVCHVVMLTSYDSKEYLHDAMKAGANGFVLKEISMDSLVKVLDDVMRGEIVFDKSTLGRVVQDIKQEADDNELLRRLTRVERNVLGLISHGRTNREISEEMYLSEKTVRNYVSNILTKLEVGNRTEAAALAIRYHLSG